MHLTRRRVSTIGPAVALVLLLTTGPAAAQPAEYRFILGGDFGLQAATHSRLERAEFELFIETARFESRYDIDSDTVFDGGGSVRLWKRAGAGVYFSSFQSASTAAITAEVPHPFFFGFERDTTGTVPALKRRETAVHLQAQYWFPFRENLLVTAFVGPTWFDVKQDQVSFVQTAERGFPFEVVDIVGHQRVSATETATGYNIGVDVAYFGLRNPLGGAAVLDHLGLAFQLRYSRATASVRLNGNRQPALELGGLHVLGGARIGF